MSKLIEIKIANPNSLRISFVMTGHCPYSCRYCPDHLHYGKHKKIDLNDLEKFLLRFQDRDCAIHLTGGECTTHPQFEDVITVCKKTNFRVCVDSNSVRTLRFYDSVKHLVDNWCITLHPSQHQLDTSKLELLAAHSFLVVYLMMDSDHWQTSLSWLDTVSQMKDLKVIPARIMDNWGGADFQANYTREQLDFLANTKSKWLFTKEREAELRKTHIWIKDTESYGFYQDGSSELLDIFSIIRKKQNNFFGWDCNVGRESICIWDDGRASWANCAIKQYDHYLDIDPEDLNHSIKCTMLECTCGTDIRGSKSSKIV